MSLTRRKFLSGAGTAFALSRRAGSSLFQPLFAELATVTNSGKKADVTLRIGELSVDVAKGRTYKTTAYNGSVPGPVLRLREGSPVTVDIFNDTDAPEYVHWHGLDIPPELDGAEEEKSLVVPSRGHLRYTMTPGLAGARYVHSHAMAMQDMTRGTYSGQYGFVYVEPERHSGRYDQEVFLATHEWGAELQADDDDDDDEIGNGRFGRKMSMPGKEVFYDVGSVNAKGLGFGEPIRVKQGQRVLFHLLNASATANTELAFAGHHFEVLALDGNPIPHPQKVDVVKLGIAERISAIVEMNNPGVWILGATDKDSRQFGQVGVVAEYEGKSGAPQWVDPPKQTWDYTVFGDPSGKSPEVDEVIPMLIDRAPMQTDGLERWSLNGKSFDTNAAPRELRSGRRYRLVFDNKTEEEHPIHLHRYSFELTKVDGKGTGGVIKDTVIVKGYGSVEVDFKPQQPGLALFHCHQQLHMDYGFKTLFKVT
jgi:FtsP/CotA-like multicopper oxidase with cupredoxin domain